MQADHMPPAYCKRGGRTSNLVASKDLASQETQMFFLRSWQTKPGLKTQVIIGLSFDRK